MTTELFITFNSAGSGDEASIQCGDICGISTGNLQRDLTIYSDQTLYGDILDCDSDEECFRTSEISCNVTSCTISYDAAEKEHACNQCLPELFENSSVFI